ncbi:MAG: hypothetical protein SFY96_01150 [Planctomycetota bacterium]|nr:hypothetical protein [Planctomycetota bacterium]
MPGVECPFCGHNLAGTPTPVCPECGQRWDVHVAFRSYAAAHLSGRIRLRMEASGLLRVAFAVVALLLAGWRLLPPRLAAGTPAWWCSMLTLPAALSCWFAGELNVSAWTARTRPMVFRILDLFEFNPR